MGFLTVIVAPPLSVVAGLGLILRWRWSRYYLLLLLAVLIGANIAELARGGVTTTRHTTASGVVTTRQDVWGGPNRHSVPIIAACAAGLVLLLPSVRREFHPPRASSAGPASSVPPPLPTGTGARDWRAGHRGRDCLYYEEWHDGAWRRIEIGGEMLMGQPHHVIYVPSPEKWMAYPDWARHRRDEILGRLRSEFPPPEYDYYFEGQSAAPLAVPSPSAAAAEAVKPGQWFALAAVILIMLALAGAMAWFVKTGLERGETFLPLKRPSLKRTVSREKEPATFWLCIGVFSTVGLGAAGFAAWLTREGLMSLGRPGSRA